MSEKNKATLYVLICISLWALIPVVSKIGQTNLDNHQFLFWSSLVSFIVLGTCTLFTGRITELKKYSKSDWIIIPILGLLGTYIYYLFLYLGYSKANGIEVLVIQYTWPILIVLFSFIILKEKLNWQKILGTLLGFLGVLLVITKGDINNIQISNPFVIVLVGAGASCFALFSVLSKKIENEPLGVTTIYFLTATISSLFSMIFFSEFSLPTISEIIPILVNGLLVNGFSYLLWLIALKLTEASYLAPFVFITPILSAIYLVVFFNEPIVVSYIFGLLGVISGGLINNVKAKKIKST